MTPARSPRLSSRLLRSCRCRQPVPRDGAHPPQAPPGARRAAAGPARAAAPGGRLGRERQRLREEIQQEKGSQGEGSALQVSLRLRGSVQDVAAAGSALGALPPAANTGCLGQAPRRGSAQKTLQGMLTGREFAPAAFRATGYCCFPCCRVLRIICSNCNAKFWQFVLGTQQLHFEPFTLNTLDDTTALSPQDVHCAFTVLPNAFDFRETNTSEYHLYYFCLLNHVHGISENYTIRPAELDVLTKHTE